VLEHFGSDDQVVAGRKRRSGRIEGAELDTWMALARDAIAASERSSPVTRP